METCRKYKRQRGEASSGITLTVCSIYVCQVSVYWTL